MTTYSHSILLCAIGLFVGGALQMIVHIWHLWTMKYVTCHLAAYRSSVTQRRAEPTATRPAEQRQAQRRPVMAQQKVVMVY